jgi:hypothetical protein
MIKSGSEPMNFAKNADEDLYAPEARSRLMIAFWEGNFDTEGPFVN